MNINIKQKHLFSFTLFKFLWDLLRVNWQYCKIFNVYIMRIWYMYILSKESPLLVNSHIYYLTYFSLFPFWWEHQFCSLSKFQLHNSVLSIFISIYLFFYSMSHNTIWGPGSWCFNDYCPLSCTYQFLSLPG